ncbi:hypothetical protein tinsulaeT_03840 [Thalassotalea insulae]|uniref:N-acetyltransferase domain-containing protein n=1 Tax=Thalassotalea insulae TaxID=2056778 RepID=A0ABQ6GP12_9GAMM|nr:GNAT family N-acetyltransferase [Thalassotalea insulae]GLX77044.1 hypothetical protein tinsulaeT_03840 [Thalassotalea insulae]
MKQTKLNEFSLNYLAELRSWFNEQTELDKWAGPNFRFPHTAQSFAQDLNTETLASYCLVNENDELLAFGQYYQRLTCCHLGRLVVNPKYRGKGLASTLIKALAKKGMQQLKLSSLSLFVLADNLTALNAYKKIGFIEQDYPEPLPLENCLYMVLPMPTWLNS